MTTPIRPILICALSASALLAQQDVTVSGSQCNSSQQAVNSITTSGPCTYSGGANVKFEAGGIIRLEPAAGGGVGFHAVASGSATFDAIVVPQAVAPALTSPASGASGPALSPQTFILTFSDPLGASDINSFQASFGGTGTASNICSLVYSGGVLGLWSDNATQLYTTLPLQNSQCAIGNYTVGSAGIILTFTVSITFLASFQGSQELYALGVSSSGDYHPWVDLGEWIVLPPTIQTRIFNSPGTYTWTAPTGVTSVQVQAWGPGGSGADSVSLRYSGSYYGVSGGGGGGGAYANKNSVPVTPGQDYTVVVGGSGSTTKTTVAGTTVIADAGQNGSQAVLPTTPGYGGAGGQASNSVGDVTQSGASGGNGGGTFGGDGGAAASGGPGGLGGGFPPHGGGSPGSSPGGGGGGGTGTGYQGPVPGPIYNGGAGANGQVVLTYAGPPATTYSITGTITASGVGLSGVTVALTGSQTATVMTDANGNYGLFNLTGGGTYTVTASRTGYSLSTPQTFANLAANHIANFTATPVPTYDLMTLVNPIGAGVISPASGPFNSGTQVTVTATAFPGYHFTGFTGNVNSSSNPVTITMNSAMTVTANFAADTTYYTLTTSVSPSGGGTIIPSCTTPCSYASGQQATLTATPNGGYQFSGWSGVDSSNGTTASVTMNSNRSVTASFIQASQVAAPSFSPAAGTYSTTQNVSITTTTGGASIRYTTDGSTPTSTTGTLYTGPVSVASTTTIKAIAYASGMTDSAVSAGTYTISGGAVAAPSFDPAPGTYSSAQTVTITSTTGGASIRYTTDGSTPTSTTGTLYSGPVSVPATTTIRAIAYASGMSDSAVTSSTYTITPGVVAAPSFSPAAGTYSSSQNVTITSTTTGATIRYTTDGSTPTSTTGTVYTGPVPVSSNTTIKAIAYASGMTDSAVTSAAYVIQGATSTRREYIRLGGRVIAIENQ